MPRHRTHWREEISCLKKRIINSHRAHERERVGSCEQSRINRSEEATYIVESLKNCDCDAICYVSPRGINLKTSYFHPSWKHLAGSEKGAKRWRSGRKVLRISFKDARRDTSEVSSVI